MIEVLEYENKVMAELSVKDPTHALTNAKRAKEVSDAQYRRDLGIYNKLERIEKEALFGWKRDKKRAKKEKFKDEVLDLSADKKKKNDQVVQELESYLLSKDGEIELKQIEDGKIVRKTVKLSKKNPVSRWEEAKARIFVNNSLLPQYRQDLQKVEMKIKETVEIKNQQRKIENSTFILSDADKAQIERIVVPVLGAQHQEYQRLLEKEGEGNSKVDSAAEDSVGEESESENIEDDDFYNTTVDA